MGSEKIDEIIKINLIYELEFKKRVDNKKMTCSMRWSN